MKKSLLLLILFFSLVNQMINAERFLIKLARLTNIYLWFVLRNVTALLPAIFKGVCKVMSK